MVWYGFVFFFFFIIYFSFFGGRTGFKNNINVCNVTTELGNLEFVLRQ